MVSFSDALMYNTKEVILFRKLKGVNKIMKNSLAITYTGRRDKCHIYHCYHGRNVAATTMLLNADSNRQMALTIILFLA